LFISALWISQGLSFLRKLEARIYEAKNGDLLGVGRWEARPGGWAMVDDKLAVKELLGAVLERTQQTSKAEEN
jgi:hypothetical protein